jgi:hypothetical protein
MSLTNIINVCLADKEARKLQLANTKDPYDEYVRTLNLLKNYMDGGIWVIDDVEPRCRQPISMDEIEKLTDMMMIVFLHPYVEMENYILAKTLQDLIKPAINKPLIPMSFEDFWNMKQSKDNYISS